MLQLPYGTGAQQATQDYALEASFLRIITTPAIPKLSNNQEDDSGTIVPWIWSSEEAIVPVANSSWSVIDPVPSSLAFGSDKEQA